MLTLITATGARPHAFGICQRLMAAQDYEGDVRWIVVDDGEQASPITFERDGWTVEVVRPEPFWQVGQNTQARNMLAGLALISSDDRLVVIEDDDHYKPDWLSVADAALSRAELVGEYLARYYNVSTKRRAAQEQRALKPMQHRASRLCDPATENDLRAQPEVHRPRALANASQQIPVWRAPCDRHQGIAWARRHRHGSQAGYDWHPRYGRRDSSCMGRQ